MGEIDNLISNLGLTGGIIAIMAYNIIFLQKKLISIIEANTKAMTGLKDSIESLIKNCSKCGE